MGSCRSLLAVLVCAMLLAGCSSTAVGTQDDQEESFTLSPKGTVASVKSIPFQIRFQGDLRVVAHSGPGPVLVVLQEEKDCGSFADQRSIPGSRYEQRDVDFTYYVEGGGRYCLSFQNRNAEPVSVNVTVSFP